MENIGIIVYDDLGPQGARLLQLGEQLAERWEVHVVAVLPRFVVRGPLVYPRQDDAARLRWGAETVARRASAAGLSPHGCHIRIGQRAVHIAAVAKQLGGVEVVLYEGQPDPLERRLRALGVHVRLSSGSRILRTAAA